MTDLYEKCRAQTMKDSIVMRHELVQDENAVFERLAKISNALLGEIGRHKPVLDTYVTPLDLDPPEVREQYECESCGGSFPCQPLSAIAKELGITEQLSKSQLRRMERM